MPSDPDILAALVDIRSEVAAGNVKLDTIAASFATSNEHMEGIVEILGAIASGSNLSVTPVWAPENSKVHIDFRANRAWTIDDGEVAISTLLGNDPLADGAWPTSYNPDDLTEDGFEGSGPLAFLGAAKSRLLAGATFRIQTTHPSSQSTPLLTLGTEDGSVSVEVDIGPNDSLEVIGAEIFVSVPDAFIPNAMNCMAVSLAAGRVEVAVNGTLRIDETLAEADWPTSGNMLDYAVSVPGGNVPVETITIYDLISDATGLAALSAVI